MYPPAVFTHPTRGAPSSASCRPIFCCVLLLLAGCAQPPSTVEEEAPTPCQATQTTLVASWADEELPQRASLSGTWPGVALGDVDGDGLPDVVGAFGGGSTLFRNLGDSTFAQQELIVDGAPAPPARAVSLVDLDGDDDLDAFLGGELGEESLILTNDGSGQFSSTALPDFDHRAWTASFGDLDGDGDLDLYVATYDVMMDLETITEGGAQGTGHAVFIQDGGVWTLEATALPAEIDPAVSLMGALLDADGDGDLDVYMANDFGPYLVPNQLLINDGAAHFAVAEACSCDLAIYAMGAAVGDANGDGAPDLYVSDVGSPHLLENDGTGAFIDTTLTSGAEIPPSETNLVSWGTTFVDLDGDGCEDILVSYGSLPGNLDVGELAGTEEGWMNGSEQQSVLLLGDCAGGFVRADEVFRDPGRGRGLAVGDLDRDGRPDVVTFGKQYARIFLTSGGCDPGISIRLRGPPGNREGIGARVEATVGGRTQTRWMLPAVTAGSSLAEIYVGLGGEAEAELRVIWPDGAITEVGAVAGGSAIEIEG